jgi:Leucine-rich repeat (LRR) protein
VQKAYNLDLGFNKLTYFEASLLNVDFLNLSNNNIEFLKNDIFKGQFSGFSTMLSIDLSNNAMRQFNYFINGLIQLRYLNLAGNQSEFFQSEKQKVLTTLHLDRNQFRLFHTNTFKNMLFLQYLNMSSNLIELIDEDLFVDLKSLVDLDLSNNSIKNIYSKIFVNLNILANLHISNNPIKILNAPVGLD